MMTLKKKELLIDDLIKEDPDSTIKDYLETIAEIEKIIKTNYGPTTRSRVIYEPGGQDEREAGSVLRLKK